MATVSIDTGNNNNKPWWAVIVATVVGGITTWAVIKGRKKEEVKAHEKKKATDYEYHQKTKNFDWELEKTKKEYYAKEAAKAKAQKEAEEKKQEDERPMPITWFGLTVAEVEQKYGNAEETTLGDAIGRSEDSVCYVPYSIYERGTTLIAGETGGGKTTLLYQMLLDLVNQRASTVFPSEQVAVPKYSIMPILLDSENLNKTGALKDRYPSDATPGLEKIQYVGGPHYDSVDDFKLFCWKRYQSLKPGDRVILCLDNATVFGKALSSNQVSSLSTFFTTSIMFAYEHNIRLSYVLVLHVIKDKVDSKAIDINNISGSSYLGYLADNVIILGNTAIGGNDKYLKIEKSRIEQKPNGAYHLLLVQKDKENDYLHFENLGLKPIEELLSKPGGSSKTTVLEMETRERVIELSKQGFTRKEIIEKLKVSGPTVDKYRPEEFKKKKKTPKK